VLPVAQGEARDERGAGAPAWVALLYFLVLAALPLRAALLDPAGTQLLGTDTATSQLPWSAHLASRGIEPRVDNAEISDQGVVFHPYLRWVVSSWLAGDPPLWNPAVYLGAPGLGNPQARVLDPQVLVLVVLEGLFGEVGFRAGLALTAWLRLGLAGFGAFLLARRLGLVGAAPWIAGTAFGLCAFTVLWLDAPLGAVPVFLPYTLLALEGLRGARPRAAFLAAAGTTAASILAGHPETAFYCGALAGLWSLALLREDRRRGVFALLALAVGGLLAAPALAPFVEYLGLSAAKEIRAAQRVVLAPAALLPLLPLFVAAALWLAARRGGRARRETLRALALVVGAAGFVAAGLPPAAGLAFAPGLFGRPGEPGGYAGPGSYLEEASAFAPLAVFVLAAAAALAGGPMRHRRLVLAATAVAFWLALRAPGLLELKQQLPLVGLGATVRLAPVAALGLALLAGEGWQSSGRRARLLALAAVAAVALPTLRPPALDVREAVAPAPSDLVLLVPPRTDERGRLVGRRIDVEGALPLAAGEQVFVVFDGPGGELPPAALEVHDEPSEAARAILAGRALPEGARHFRSPYLDASRLDEGAWSADLVVLASDGATVRRREPLLAFDVVRERRFGAGFALCAALALVLPLVGGAARAAAAGPFVALLALRLVLFAEDQNPATPIERVFPLTATEEVLLELPRGTRLFADPGVFPPCTALTRGLWSAAGYDGMEPLDYARWVEVVLPPGAHQLLSWHAAGIDPNATVFQLGGVTHLALATWREVPGWRVVAGPGPSAPRFAEVWVLADETPLPRAYCVPTVVDLATLAATNAADPYFDPRTAAVVASDWRPARPFTRSTVGAPRFTNTTVELEVELDGDGLLVLGELDFPGWRVEVDGEERAVETAFGVLRAVALGPGAHRVRFHYWPHTLTLGLAAAAVGAGLALLAVLVLAREGSAR
jgi:hypothetical protein